MGFQYLTGADRADQRAGIGENCPNVTSPMGQSGRSASGHGLSAGHVRSGGARKASKRQQWGRTAQSHGRDARARNPQRAAAGSTPPALNPRAALLLTALGGARRFRAIHDCSGQVSPADRGAKCRRQWPRVPLTRERGSVILLIHGCMGDDHEDPVSLSPQMRNILAVPTIILSPSILLIMRSSSTMFPIPVRHRGRQCRCPPEVSMIASASSRCGFSPRPRSATDTTYRTSDRPLSAQCGRRDQRERVESRQWLGLLRCPIMRRRAGIADSFSMSRVRFRSRLNRGYVRFGEARRACARPLRGPSGRRIGRLNPVVLGG